VNKNWVFTPHVLIAASYWAWSHHVLGAAGAIALAIGMHLAAPAWAAFVAKRHVPWRAAPWTAFWSGPGVLVGIHAASVLIELWRILQAPPADWLAVLAWLAVWAIAIAVYAGYAVVVFTIALRRSK